MIGMVYLSMMRNRQEYGPINYPSGICVKTSEGYFYLKGSKRYRIQSKQILRSWRFPRIIGTKESALEFFPVGGKLGFRAGTVVYDIANRKFYYIDESRRRLITNVDEVLYRLRIKRSDVILVGPSDIDLHTEGDELL